MPLDHVSRMTSITGVVITCLNFPLNLMIILPNVWYLWEIAPSSFLAFWLCLIDAISIANMGLIAILSLANETIEESPVICQLHACFTTFASLASILICFGLTLFRYLIVVQKRTLPRFFTTFYLMGVFTVAGFVSTPPFMTGSADLYYTMRPSKAYCGPKWSLHDPRSLVLIITSLGVASFTVVFITYAYMAMVGKVMEVLTLTKDLASSAEIMPQQQDSVDANTGYGSIAPKILGSSCPDVESVPLKPRKPEKGVNKETAEMEKLQFELMRQSIVIVCAFIIGWAPYLFMAVYEVVSGSPVSPACDFAATFIVAVYEGVNPIIVFIYDRDLGKNCRRVILGSYKKVEVNA
ncbi:hypothetical protein HDU81_008703 [Chytriomyces hyalinus]|nr:hypothetical protein HDU81_008703 [Chytriomyces hyalinus]